MKDVLLAKKQYSFDPELPSEPFGTEKARGLRPDIFRDAILWPRSEQGVIMKRGLHRTS